MNKYRITKYNPSLRGANGKYLKEDWTAISDIGKLFNGEKLSIEAYIKVEDSYIAAIQLIMQYINVPYLTVNNVNRSFSYKEFNRLIKDYKCLYTEDVLDTYLNIKNMNNLNNNKLENFCRLLLREDLGAEVYYNNIIKVYIGYDYLMGVHSSISLEEIIPQIEQMGLFVETFDV